MSLRPKSKSSSTSVFLKSHKFSLTSHILRKAKKREPMDSAERRRSETDIGGGPRNSADARPSLDLSSDPMLESNLALRKLSEAFG
ncbi:Protein CBG16151, partial [Caenorhabditis briggsae]